MKNTLKKQTVSVFKSKYYLLGEDKCGIKYWLCHPSRDNDWYWGFGYVHAFTNNNHPERSKDIISHEHIDGSFIGYFEDKYVQNIYDSPRLTKTTFSEKDGWMLSELFKQFYLLKDMAEYCHKKPVPGCNISTVKDIDFSKEVNGWYETINEVMLPRIFEKIINILSPNAEEHED